MWAHEKTQQWLGWFVSQGGISQVGADALIDLSAPVTHPFASVTAQQCEAAWEADELATKRTDWRTRFDAALNTIGTSEQAAGVADLRAIASEVEAA